MSECPNSITADVLASAVTSALKQMGVSFPGLHDSAASAHIIPPERLFAEWLEIDRCKPIAVRYRKNAEAVFHRFASFVGENYPQIRDIRAITSQIAKAFLKKEYARGIADKTYNNFLILLRSAFKELVGVGSHAGNPFEGLKRKRADMIGRDCFTETELQKIFEEAARDDFIGPIVILAATTAMRRGDCCLLKREAIDLDEQLVRVKTRKTSQYVWIPMLPLLASQLERQLATRAIWAPQDYVFPEQAAMYLENPDGITWRFKMLLRHAGVRGDDDSDQGAERGQRLRKPSCRGCHAFRTTWVTLALNHGVPETIVLDVTGIRTIQIARTHYFNPQMAHYRAALGSKLPAILRTGRPEVASASASEKSVD